MSALDDMLAQIEQYEADVAAAAENEYVIPPVVTREWGKEVTEILIALRDGIHTTTPEETK